MTGETWSKLDREFTEYPMLWGGASEPEEADEAAAALGVSFHEDYKEFLLRYGGAMVGSNPILGLRQAEVMGDDCWSVVHATRRFRSEAWPGSEDWYVVSVDAHGNPIGIAPSGAVLISDHDTGAVVLLSETFEAFIVSLLNRR